VESLVFAANVELGENHHVLGVDGSVGDPVFLGKRVWGVHDEFFGFVVVDGCGLHLDGVVSVPQLRQSEASHVVQAVDTVEEFVVVALRPKLEDRPAKQVELDGHFRRHGRVDHRRKLVGGKYSEWIVSEVHD